MRRNESYLVYIYVDKKTSRITATAKLGKYLSDDTSHFKSREKVDLWIWSRTDLGYKCLVNEEFQGILYDNEVFATA